MLITLIILTVVFLGLLLWGWKSDCDDTMSFGTIGLLLVVLIGWVLLGNILPIKTTNTEIVANVLHDKESCHLSVSNAIVATYTDFATVSFLADKDSVKIVKTQGYNMYGGVAPKTSITITGL
jgi:hypothetical protein